MKILIVSRTPWDNSNSFGNTFSNLFEGMPDVEIFNICCQTGNNDNNVVHSAYQMTDVSVLRSITGKDAGQVIGRYTEDATPDKLETKLPRRRITFFYIMRDVIWKIGRWKSDSLKQFIDSIKPDILYLPLYRSGYMIDVQKYVIKHTGVPVAVHITDDIYNYAPAKLTSPLKTIYQAYIRRGIRRIISKSAYGEVFAQDMANEYSKLFDKPFHLIGKGIDTDKITPNDEWLRTDKLHFVYTGNYGGERGNQLVTLALAIKKHLVDTGHDACIDIYSTTKAEPAVDKALTETGCVNLCGGVKGDQLKHIQRRADFLVHVEGFSKNAIYETRLSFSTKIIDYLIARRPIVAIGPEQVNSIKVLAEHRLAIIATSPKEIDEAISNVASNPDSLKCDVAGIDSYLSTHRNIYRIRQDIYQRLSDTIDHATTN